GFPGPLRFLLGALALSDVLHGAAHAGDFTGRIADQVLDDFEGQTGAVAANVFERVRNQLLLSGEPAHHRLAARILVLESNKVPDGFPQNFSRRLAEQSAFGVIHAADDAVGVDLVISDRGLLKHPAEALFTSPHGLLGALEVGDIDHVDQQVVSPWDVAD